MNSDDKNIAARLRQLIQSQSNFQQGRLTSSAGTGGLVTAKLPDGTQVTATAGNDCSGGDCSLFRLEDGSYIVMSGNASQLVSKQTTTYRKSTPPEDPDQGKYLKVLFSKVENTKRVFYIGGDRTTPVKIHEADATDVVKAAYISCTGEGKNKWVVALAIQKSIAITIWHITAKEAEKKSWVDTKNEIYPLLTYNGFGMWSAGTFIAPTMAASDFTSTVGDTKTTTTTYTVESPSFVTGTGQVIDTNLNTKKTIKKAEKCYETVMRRGACTSTTYQRTGTELGKGAFIAAYSMRGMTDAAWDTLLRTVTGFIEIVDYYYTPVNSAPKASRIEQYAAAPTPFSVLATNTSCSPDYPSQNEIACPGTGYGGDTTIPGTQTRTISGGFNLTTKSFLVKDGNYSDRDGSVRMVISGEGKSSGTSTITMTTTTTYSYQGASWVNRENLVDCQGSDRTVAVDIEPGEASVAELREVCLAVGSKSEDRITYLYSQEGSNRQEKLFLNSKEIPCPVGFVLFPQLINDNPNTASFSSKSQYVEKSEYKETSLRTYLGNPVYTSSPTSLAQSSVVRSYYKKVVATNLASGLNPKALPTSQINLATLSSITTSPNTESVSSNVTQSSSLSRIEMTKSKSFTTEAPLFGSGAETDSVLSSTFTGLLAEPEGGFVDLANPYLRALSISPRQSDTVSHYRNPLVSIVRSLGSPSHVFYDKNRIMVSPAASKDFGYSQKKVKVFVLPGVFDAGGAFKWEKPEGRICHSLLMKTDETGFIVHSTSAWF